MNYNFYSKFFEYAKIKCPESIEEVNFEHLSKLKKSQYKILIDYSSCKNRLYGGFFSDWIGGEWKKMNSFFNALKEACITHNLVIIIVFDGTTPAINEKDDFKFQQVYEKTKMNNLYNGYFDIQNWVAPSFLHKQIQFETQNLNNSKDYFSDSRCLISFSTYKDHGKEILNYCYKHDIDAFLTEDMQIISLLQIQKNLIPQKNSLNKMIFCSAQSFKLTSYNKVTASKYDIQSILNFFNLDNRKFVYFSILLGTKLMPNQSFISFYEKLISCQIFNIYKFKGLKKDQLIEKIIEFINEYDNLKEEEILNLIFEKAEGILREKYLNDFKSNLNYYEVPFTKYDIFGYGNNDEKLKFVEVLRKKHINNEISEFIIGLVENKKIFLPLAKEPSKIRVRINEIFRPIRKKCYSLIFTQEIFESNPSTQDNLVDKLEKLDIKKFEVKEYFLNFDNEIVCSEVPVIPLNESVNIQNLWESRSRKERSNIFLDIINCSEIQDDLINLIDKRILIALLVLRYILKNNGELLGIDNLKAFALTFINGLYMESFPSDLLKNQPNIRQVESIYLLELFLKGMEYFYFANCVCGKPFSDKYFCLANFFQGTAFQVYFYRIRNNQEDIKRLINHYNEDFNRIMSFLKYELDNSNDVNQNEISSSIEEISFNQKITDLNENKSTYKVPLGRGILGKNHRRNESQLTCIRSHTTESRGIHFFSSRSRDRSRSLKQNNDINYDASMKKKTIKQEKLYPFPEETCLLIEKYFYKINLKEKLKSKPTNQRPMPFIMLQSKSESQIPKYSLENPPKYFKRPDKKMVPLEDLPKIPFTESKLEEMRKYLEKPMTDETDDENDE